MHIRTAVSADMAEIWELYRSVVAAMHERGLFQWGDEYPTLEILTEDMELQNLIIGELDGKIVCAGVLNGEEGAPPEYADGAWQYPDADYCMIHRLAVSPSAQGRGLAKQMIAALERLTLERGASVMRIDTFDQNEIAIGLYLGVGYTEVGRMEIPNYAEGKFVLFEKILKM